MVQTIPALTPENRSATAKMVPEAWPIVRTNNAYTPGKSALAAASVSELAATIRIEELMKSVMMKSETHISAMEYDMQDLIAESVGR